MPKQMSTDKLQSRGKIRLFGIEQRNTFSSAASALYPENIHPLIHNINMTVNNVPVQQIELMTAEEKVNLQTGLLLRI